MSTALPTETERLCREVELLRARLRVLDQLAGSGLTFPSRAVLDAFALSLLGLGDGDRRVLIAERQALQAGARPRPCYPACEPSLN